jgi:hypothetical protein
MFLYKLLLKKLLGSKCSFNYRLRLAYCVSLSRINIFFVVNLLKSFRTWRRPSADSATDPKLVPLEDLKVGARSVAEAGGERLVFGVAAAVGCLHFNEFQQVS